MPPGDPNPTLATFSKLVEKDIEAVIESNNRLKNCNISVFERKALTELRDNCGIIVIKPADKGGAVGIKKNTQRIM